MSSVLVLGDISLLGAIPSSSTFSSDSCAISSVVVSEVISLLGGAVLRSLEIRFIRSAFTAAVVRLRTRLFSVCVTFPMGELALAITITRILLAAKGVTDMDAISSVGLF